MNKIAEFVDSFVPENLPRKRADSLKDELTCHILDKRDYYMQIGYDEDASVDKAIADFGTDEVCKNYIYNEFEELYSERSIFGIAAFAIISVMNILCFYLDCWIWSADYNKTPEPTDAMISFTMILIVLAMIVFARIEKHRKTLISIGVANTAVAAYVLASFYPQMAAYTMTYNVIYLIDRFTPISMGSVILGDYGDTAAMVWSWLILLLTAIYCFVEAFRIKRGTAKSVRNPRKKLITVGVSFFAVAVVSSLMITTTENYIVSYPQWIDKYSSYISVETEHKFDEIALGQSYNEVCERLKNYGYISTDSYKEKLDKLTKKQFENELKCFNFADGYEIWFNPDEYIDGNGYIGLKHENGIVTAKGTGNMKMDMYDKYGNFGVHFSYENCNMSSALGCFKEMHKGDSETVVMSKFGKEYGRVYTKRIENQNGKIVSYYRVMCLEDTFNTENYSTDTDERYFEFTFRDGKLSDGIMYRVADYPAKDPIETMFVSEKA